MSAIPQCAESQEAKAPVEIDATPIRHVLAYALALGQHASAEVTEEPNLAPMALTPEQVRALPKAELRTQLDALILSRHADLALTVLQRCGVLDVILPEVSSLVGFGEGHNQHKDVWKHTLQVVIQSVPRLRVRWAALFHDIAKPRTRSVSPDGAVHFLHHAELGARMFLRIARREQIFEDDPEFKEAIRFLIYHHQRAHQYDQSWTDSATRRFAAEMGDHLDDLMALSRADMTTKRREKKRRFMLELKELQERVEKLAEEDAKPKALPKGLGQALIDTFRLPPSKLVGDIRKELERAVENAELPLQADFDIYLTFVRDNPIRFGLPQ